MPSRSFKIPRPLQYVLIVIVSAAVIFAAIKLGGIYKRYLWIKHTRENALAKLSGEVNEIQKDILAIQQVPQNLGYVLEFSKPTSEEMKILLESIVTNDDEVFGICVAFEPNKFYKDSTHFAPYLYKKDGQIFNSNPTDTNYNYFSLDWYLIPKLLNKGVWIEPYFDDGEDAGNIIMTTYSVPFYSFDGINETMSGIIAVDVSIEWLSKIVSSIKFENGSYPILVSENGTIMSAPNPKWIYNESLFSLADENNLPLLREVGRNLQKGKTGSVNIGHFGTDKNWWVYYMPIPENKWGVLLMVPEN